ncbi:hypothetical protein C2845_PM10G18770 [Panicum miliaceum]|uniref:DUF1618 domain-containing protein n=1 Tax=Panicum miliaceum TaxID=4540 RepID=A0A3L6PDL0_PANMI|nr:hypothetical protein C2845_PM10G18770 [Panicum miliaceum]
MAVFTEDGDRAFDYFVHRAGGPGSGAPSLDLIPGPHPKTYQPKQIGVLHCGGGQPEPHYAVVFPARRIEALTSYEMHVFSSETQAWSTNVAEVVEDRETGCYDMVKHRPSKAVPAGGGRLAWVDLWRGVVLCNVLADDPVLRMLQWPVPPPRGVQVEVYDARSIRDAAVGADGAVRFLKLSFDHDADRDGGGAWTATAWRREAGSEYWFECFRADIAGILADDSSFSHLLSKVWGDEVRRRCLSKVFSHQPLMFSPDAELERRGRGLLDDQAVAEGHGRSSAAPHCQRQRGEAGGGPSDPFLFDLLAVRLVQVGLTVRVPSYLQACKTEAADIIALLLL